MHGLKILFSILLILHTCAFFLSCSNKNNCNLDEVCNGIDENCNNQIDEEVFGIISGPTLIHTRNISDCLDNYILNSCYDGLCIITWQSTYRDEIYSRLVYYGIFNENLELIDGPNQLSDAAIEDGYVESGGKVIYNDSKFWLLWISYNNYSDDTTAKHMREIGVGFKGEIYPQEESDLILWFHDSNNNYMHWDATTQTHGSPQSCDIMSPEFGTCTGTFRIGYRNIVFPDYYSNFIEIFGDDSLGLPADPDRGSNLYFTLYSKYSIVDRQWMNENVTLLMFEGSANPENKTTIVIDLNDIFPGAVRYGNITDYVLQHDGYVYSYFSIEPVLWNYIHTILKVPLSYPSEKIELYNIAEEMEGFCEDAEFEIGSATKKGRLQIEMLRGAEKYLQLWKCVKYYLDSVTGQEYEEESFLVYGHSTTPAWPYKSTGTILPVGNQIVSFRVVPTIDGGFIVLYLDAGNEECSLMTLKLGCLLE